MTNRNELERLLAAATKGPWEPEYDPIGDGDEHATAICLPGLAGQIGTFIAYCQHNWNDADAGEHRISWKEATSNAALICFLRNNAQHYLSLMDEVERLRGELGWAIETLHEINPSNYDHDDVCALNSASVEVILGLQKALGETHDR